jgi:hypothetical protein
MQTAAQTTLRARVDNDAEFLRALKDTGNVTVACMAAGFDRSHIYKRRERDIEFKEAWERAIEVSIDKLELVARNRAVKGAKRELYYKGRPCGTIYEPSDRLMELLLKAHRPDKFNPVQKLEHSGGIAIAVVQFGQLVTQPQPIEHDVTLGAGSEELRSDLTQAGAVPSTEALSNQAPGASLPDLGGGAIPEGGTPKLPAAQNDEPCHVARFSDSEAE